MVLLEKLLAAAERRAQDWASITLPLTPKRAPQYVSGNTLAEREAIHAVLSNAEAAGAVSLEWGRFEEARDLKRLRLMDADRLAEFLGQERVGVRLARIRETVRPVLEPASPWLRSVFDEAVARWQRGESAHRLKVDDLAEIVMLYRALDAVDREKHHGLDLRTFSARVLGDSKAMERLQGRIAAVLRAHLGLSDLNDAEVYAELGLEKYPQPLFLKGPLELSYGGKRLELEGVCPYLAVSPDGITEIASIGRPDYILVIENLTSYQRHVREVDDRGIVLYSGGFPGPTFRALLRRLDEHLDDGVPFFHWGDVDLGGLRIFARLADTLSGHALRPHLMQAVIPDLTGVRSFSRSEIGHLERMAAREGLAGDLAREWLTLGSGAREQEALEPRSPVGSMRAS